MRSGERGPSATLLEAVNLRRISPLTGESHA